MSSFAGYKMVGANAYSKQVGWAMELAKWITNEENQTIRFEKRGQGPSNIKAAESESVNEAPAIKALVLQSEYAKLQRISDKYWDPVAAFGGIMVDGNSEGKDLQKIMDDMVAGITAAEME